ncbi:MAG: response regulator transcription factor [Rhodoferax sp.]|nr:response regulator transcription factor [Rhodoferax sp.]
MSVLNLMVVDDHNLFRRGLVALLAQDGRFTVQCQAGDMGEALREVTKQSLDLILLDNNLPGVRGVDGIASLKDACPGVRILMLTVSEDEDDLAAAMQAGADGYLLKTVESEQLCDAIVRVLAGEPVISPEMMTKFVSAFRAKPLGIDTPMPNPTHPALDQNLVPQADAALESLSGREREILRFLAQGESNKAIARALDIAEATVKVHVQNLLRKLQLTSRVQAAVFAAARGLL